MKTAQPRTSHIAEPSGRTVYEFHGCNTQIVISNPTRMPGNKPATFSCLAETSALRKGDPQSNVSFQMSANNIEKGGFLPALIVIK